MRPRGGYSAAVRRAVKTTLFTAPLAVASKSLIAAPHLSAAALSPYTRWGSMAIPIRRLATAAAAAAASPPAAVSSPSSSTASPQTEATADPTSTESSVCSAEEDTPNICLLCDTSFTSWPAHCREPAHIARTAICRFFVMPDRSESLMQHLEKHIALDLKEVDALTLKKVERRRRRLLAGLLHMVEEGVLQDCLPLPHVLMSTSALQAQRGASGALPQRPAKNKSENMARPSQLLEVQCDRFLTRLLVGEAYMRREVIDRSARLVPRLTAEELEAVASYLMSTRQLARIFDELSFQSLVTAYTKKVEDAAAAADANEAVRLKEEKEREEEDGAAAAAGATTSSFESKPAGEGAVAATADVAASSQRGAAFPSSPRPAAKPFSRNEKAAVLLSCIGELEHFHRRDRIRSVSSKASADAVVLNVIATHARDNLISELIHEALQRIVDEGTAVWKQHQKEVSRRTLAAALESRITESRNGASRGAKSSTKMAAAASTFQCTPSHDASLLQMKHVRKTPLAAAPAPRAEDPTLTTLAGARSSPLWDAAAAERLISSYVCFRDATTSANDGAPAAKLAGSDPTPPGSDAKERPAPAVATLGEPVHVSAISFSVQHWEPLQEELKRRGLAHRRLLLPGAIPRVYRNDAPEQAKKS